MKTLFIVISILVGMAAIVAILVLSIIRRSVSNKKANAIFLWEDGKIPHYMEDNKAMAAYLDRTCMNRTFAKLLAKGNYEMKPKLQPFLLKTGKCNPSVIVCPGGGYMTLAAESVEGIAIAKWLNSIGLSAFVLDYRCVPYAYPVQLEDAKRAIRYVRYHADEFNIDSNRVAVMGFSAGGHVASMLATQFDNGDASATDPVDLLSSRPDAVALCYAVITMGEYAHTGSLEVIMGGNETQERRDLLSGEKQVTSDTPPAFIWHTEDDKVVPVENAKLFAQALEEKGVPYELHLFPEGKHGLGLAKKQDGAREWPAMCEEWFKRIGFKP